MSKEELASEVCDHYCKYPEMFGRIGKELGLDHDDAEQWMLEMKCSVCPLMELIDEEVKQE